MPPLTIAYKLRLCALMSCRRRFIGLVPRRPLCMLFVWRHKLIATLTVRYSICWSVC